MSGLGDLVTPDLVRALGVVNTALEFGLPSPDPATGATWTSLRRDLHELEDGNVISDLRDGAMALIKFCDAYDRTIEAADMLAQADDEDRSEAVDQYTAWLAVLAINARPIIGTEGP